jgi:dual specificity phosphatase 12
MTTLQQTTETQSIIKPSTTNTTTTETKQPIVEDKIDISKQLYCCRQCRKVLFDGTLLLSHETTNNNNCTSYFLQNAPAWITEKDIMKGVNEGKLYCPHCNTKFGSFSWSGDTCSCGTW